MYDTLYTDENTSFDTCLQDYLKESGLQCTQAVMDDVKYVPYTIHKQYALVCCVLRGWVIVTEALYISHPQASDT